MELTALVSSSFVVAVGKVRDVGAEFFASFVQLSFNTNGGKRDRKQMVDVLQKDERNLK